LSSSIFNIICCFLFSANVFAQNKFSGKVVNDADLSPIAGASVYFNNTSIGTITNEKGEFSISNAISGEVIISSVGYERLIYKPAADQFNRKSFVFKLVEKQATLRDILILPDAVRKKYLALFQKNFLGITEEADRSSITNLSAINFSAADEKKAFIAYSDTPLTIINKKLGYIIRFELVEFYYNEQTAQTSFYGYTRYEDMGDKKRWAKNRQAAYYGSSMHFFRSLISNNLKEESFSIARVKADSMKQVNDQGNSYFEKFDLALPLNVTDIVQRDSVTNLHVVSWKDRLMVQYYKNPVGKNYLSKKIMLMGGLPTGVRSYLTIKTDNIEVDNYGILSNPMNILFSGYWVYEKAANFLPYNYYPN
jgi:CarboxypepD_reg-like domain